MWYRNTESNINRFKSEGISQATFIFSAIFIFIQPCLLFHIQVECILAINSLLLVYFLKLLGPSMSPVTVHRKNIVFAIDNVWIDQSLLCLASIYCVHTSTFWDVQLRLLPWFLQLPNNMMWVIIPEFPFLSVISLS